MVVSIGTIKTLNIVKTNYLILLLFAAFSSLSIQCKEDEKIHPQPQATLPAITSDGYNTFGCKLNGTVWPTLPEKEYEEFWMDYWDGIWALTLYIDYDDFDGVTDATMTLKTNDIHDTGYYVIPYGDNVSEQFSIRNGWGINQIRFFSSDKINRDGKDSAYFHILRFDTQKRIIAGTFKFSLFNKQGTQRLHVTDGRFDWHY
jgi:hypothetical protein